MPRAGPDAVRHTIIVAALAFTGCMRHGVPADRSIEATFPQAPPARSLPPQLRIVTCNVHGEPGHVIARALRADRALRSADVIVLQEVHRHEPAADRCSGACALGRELGFHAVYAPGHDNGHGSDGVAIVSRA